MLKINPSDRLDAKSCRKEIENLEKCLKTSIPLDIESLSNGYTFATIEGKELKMQKIKSENANTVREDIEVLKIIGFKKQSFIFNICSMYLVDNYNLFFVMIDSEVSLIYFLFIVLNQTCFIFEKFPSLCSPIFLQRNLKAQIFDDWTEIKRLMYDVLNGLSFWHENKRPHFKICPG